MRSRHCGELIRSLRNLEASRKGNGFILFACTKRTKSTPKGCDPLDSRGRFKALSKKILAEFSNGTSRNRLFAQNGGEKALNRCEVSALQRKELERRLKEQPYSLRTVGYGWVRICGVCGGKGLFGKAIRKGLFKQKAFGLRKSVAFEGSL